DHLFGARHEDFGEPQDAPAARLDRQRTPRALRDARTIDRRAHLRRSHVGHVAERLAGRGVDAGDPSDLCRGCRRAHAAIYATKSLRRCPPLSTVNKPVITRPTPSAPQITPDDVSSACA